MIRLNNIQISSLILILLVFVNCKNNNSTSSDLVLIENKTNKISDSLSSTSTENIELDNQNNQKYNNLNIYPFSGYDKKESVSTGFIPLTDSFPWSDNKDSIVIAKEFIGDNIKTRFHILKSEFRKRFLKICKIKESDNVYIYNYEIDSTYIFKVSELPILAHITQYNSDDEPCEKEEYLIGFDLESKFNLNNKTSYYNALVFVGNENIFNENKLKPILWNVVDSKNFQNIKTKLKLNNLKINKLYKYQMNEMDYFLINQNRLIIIDTKNNETLIDTTFEEGESASFAPLSFVGKKNENQFTQWTGNLFKNKPPVFFGFMYESFGCESINFIEKQGDTIYIKCDNRH